MKEMLLANPAAVQICAFAFSAVAVIAGIMLKRFENKKKRAYQLSMAKDRLKVFQY